MIAAIIQARMTSYRFPGKVMADLCGKPVLQHVIERCRAINGVNHVMLAVGGGGLRPVYDLAKKMQIRVHHGSEDDVLERYLGAADSCGADTVMRITADCPMLRPDLCDEVLKLYQGGGCSYAAIGWPRTFPKGYGCEVFSHFTLKLANELATDQYDREHVTPWMERETRCKYLTQETDESYLSYCVDTADDLERLRLLGAANV